MGARERLLHGISSAVETQHRNAAYRSPDRIPRAHTSLEAPFHVNAPLSPLYKVKYLTRNKATTK